MSTRELLRRAAEFATNPSNLGETVGYYPEDGSPALTFRAVVNRIGRVSLDDDTVSEIARLFVPNGGLFGLAAAPQDGDEFELSMTEGGPQIRARFVDMIEQGPDGFLFEVEK